MIALDFRKAYASIDRGKLIETLVKYKINPLIINMVAKVYIEEEHFVKYVIFKSNQYIQAGSYIFS